MNSVLQCLIHTPPLAELLLSARCPKTVPGAATEGGPDILAATRDLMQRSLLHRTGVLSPVAHARSLRRINRRCGGGGTSGEGPAGQRLGSAGAVAHAGVAGGEGGGKSIA